MDTVSQINAPPVQTEVKRVQSKLVGYGWRALLPGFTVAVVLAYIYLLATNSVPNNDVVFSYVIAPIIVILPLVLGWLINRKHPGHTIALLFLLMGYCSASGHIAFAIGMFNRDHPGQYFDQINAAMLTIGHIMWIPGVFFPIFLVPLYFPTGRLLSKRWWIPLAVLGGNLAMMVIGTIFRPWPWLEYGIPDTRTPNGIPGSEAFFDYTITIQEVTTIPVFLCIPVALFLRYRRSQGIERIQMKWPLASLLIFFLYMVINWTFPTIGDFDAQYGYPLTWMMAMVFPTSIGIAILRHRLFDIDLFLYRTVIYGILTVLVVLVYILIVGGLGAMFQSQTSMVSGMIATGVVAVIFQPIRERLQRLLSRVMYGNRDEPALVFSQLAYHLETTQAPTDILPNLVQSIAHTLKIPYVAIWLQTEQDRMEVVAAWGDAPEQREMLSLVYQNQTIGYLVVAPRAANERFTEDERTLLATIAALTASTVHAVQLSDELRVSRQRIVTAREEERRRIRRDLHDGLGPQLASQTLGLEAIAQLIPIDPQKAQSLLQSLQSQAQEAVLDIRRLVYDLRPPALDDLGLIGALKQSAVRYESANLNIRFDIAALPDDLPAAIETALYRITQEAMTNVVRHAQAANCWVRIECDKGDLMVRIEDDGCGLPANYLPGIGLQTMHERAAELNGETVVQRRAQGGTRIQTRLPLAVSHG